MIFFGALLLGLSLAASLLFRYYNKPSSVSYLSVRFLSHSSFTSSSKSSTRTAPLRSRRLLLPCFVCWYDAAAALTRVDLGVAVRGAANELPVELTVTQSVTE